MVRLRGELRRDRNDVEIVEPQDVLRFLHRSLLRVRGLCIERNPVARVLEGDPMRVERSGRGGGGRLDDIDLRRNCARGRRGGEQEERQRPTAHSNTVARAPRLDKGPSVHDRWP